MEPLTATRLDECRQLAAMNWPPGTAQHQLAAAVRDLGREIERMRDAARATPSADAVAPEPITLRSGRVVCRFHQLELGETGVCIGCAADAKAARDLDDDRRTTCITPAIPRRPALRPVHATAAELGTWRTAHRQLVDAGIPAPTRDQIQARVDANAAGRTETGT